MTLLKKNWLRYVLALIVLWLIFVIVRFPAERAAALLQDQGVQLQLSGIKGTVWQGQAGTLLLGRERIENLRWDIQQLDMLTGSLAVSVSGEYKGQPFDVVMGRSLLGGLFIEADDMSLTQLEKMFMPAPMGFSGTVDIDLHGIEIDGRHLLAVEGGIEIHDSALESIRVELGDYRIDLVTNEQGITGTFSDDDAKLGVEGEVILANNGNYTLDLAVEVRDTNSRELRQAVALLGGGSALTGKAKIRRSGRLPF